MDSSLLTDSWRDDLADRLRYCADLVDGAVLEGRIRFTVYVGKLSAIGARLRGLAAEARTAPQGAEFERWCAHVADEARDLGIRLRVASRLRACADEAAHEDLVLVASELAVMAGEADELDDERTRSREQAQGGAA